MILPSTGTYELGPYRSASLLQYRVHDGKVEARGAVYGSNWFTSLSYHQAIGRSEHELVAWVHARLAEMLTPPDIPAECSIMHKQLEVIAKADTLKDVEEAVK